MRHASRFTLNFRMNHRTFRGIVRFAELPRNDASDRARVEDEKGKAGFVPASGLRSSRELCSRKSLTGQRVVANTVRPSPTRSTDAPAPKRDLLQGCKENCSTG